MNKKILWIENLKGLTILAVVLGHIATPLTGLIYSWHIPAFFFLSGFFINNNRSMPESVKKESKRLFLPFLIFGCVGLMMELIKRNVFSGFEFAVTDFSLIKEFQGLFFWMDYAHMHQYGFVLWFLAALFWGKLILQFILAYIKNIALVGLICLLLFLTLANQNFILPFALDKGLFSLVWLFGGYLFYNYCIKEEKLGLNKYFILIAAVLLAVLPVSTTDIAVKVAPIPLASLLYGFSIIALLVAIFRTFGDKYLNNSFFESWGKNSLIILILHPYTNNIGYVIAKKFFSGSWSVNFIISVIILMMLLLSIRYAKNTLKNSRFAYRFQSAGTN